MERTTAAVWDKHYLQGTFTTSEPELNSAVAVVPVLPTSGTVFLCTDLCSQGQTLSLTIACAAPSRTATVQFIAAGETQ